MEWFEKSPEELLNELNTSPKGLMRNEAKVRLQQYGPNQLPEKKKSTGLQIFLEQFKNFLVAILIVAAVISYFAGEVLDSVAIVAIVVLNAIFGFLQERKAERTLEALKKFAAPKSKVMRDNEVLVVDSSQIVPGDIVVLEVGDKIPADCRIIEENNVKADESILTGESLPIKKTKDALSGGLAVADRKNMLFSGTTVVFGRCKAVVVDTGLKTEFGKIAKVLQERDEPSPLQKKLGVLGKNLGMIILVICGLVFVAGMLNGIGALEMFLTSVSLAVAAIPEGLPAVVTVTLAIGLARMVKKNAIIRKLPAAETLGSTTVICSDKTGTLTKNEMTVRKIYTNEKVFEVTGDGYSKEGKFILAGGQVSKDQDLDILLRTGMLCNDASMSRERVGDPTEIALLVSAKKYGIEDMRVEVPRVKEIEFDPDRMMMSVVCKVEGRNVMYTKGALESVIKRCNTIYRNGQTEAISDADKKKITDANDEFSKNALRVLAFAVRNIADGEEPKEENLTFVGLQSMVDPPRPEVRQSIDKCRNAGVKVVMITGDHKNTAVAVAKELDIIDDEKNALTGEELDKIKEEDFLKMVDSISVYARVSPEHKVRITDALKKKGHIVAMTGDGVNDAPALKKADIGIAMGITGTDVAKEASDMILTDDNFASIVSAVEEGRGIYDNIKKFIDYLLSSNIGEVSVVFGALLLALPLPLLPLQLLWMNLVTDGLPAIALGMEPYEPDIMKRKPRNPRERVLNRESLGYILIVGMAIAVATLYLFYTELPDLPRARTMAFTMLVVLEMAIALSFRSPKYLFGSKIGKNRMLWIAILSSLILQVMIVHVPFFNRVFNTVPLNLSDWARILISTFFIFIGIEINKVLKIRKQVYRAGNAGKSKDK